MSAQIFRAIGLMSGTSGDGVDAAYIETDGHGFVQAGEAITLPYTTDFRRRLMAVMGNPDDASDVPDHAALSEIEQELTDLHTQAVDILLTQMGKRADEIDIIGFHGQTIFHDPANRKTLQIGDGARLAAATGIDVVNDFRSADVSAGGQGAPIASLYHAAIASAWEKPCAIVNIGGVANVTYLGPDDEIYACDIGTGSALIDDAMQEFFGLPHDMDGGIAATGNVNEALLKTWLADEFFALPAPKSLDRNHFKTLCDVSNLMPDDAIATLTEFTARAIAKSAELFPAVPRTWYITGGGRKNKYLMTRIAAATPATVKDINDMGWDGDALESQAWGYLPVRHVLNLPLSLPSTTGVPVPTCGGVFHKNNL